MGPSLLPTSRARAGELLARGVHGRQRLSGGNRGSLGALRQLLIGAAYRE